ncbi:MAG: hypothetical protein D6773_08570 [Alphaproteobacteria bacterium]|nr:MAG: hypothetical protein D6773_08570 [Alphaproteobacteria bacterium]
MLAPAAAEWIIRAIQRLLVSFYIPDQTPREYAMVLDNFVEALKDLPRWAITDACRSWLRSEKRRPTPAEIRALAAREAARVHEEIADREKMRQIGAGRREVSAEEAKRRRDLVREMVEAGRLPASLAGKTRER